MDSNFVMWVPGGKSPAQRAAASAAAAKRVGARSLPFLGVVNSASVTDKMSVEQKLKRSTVALHHCNPPPSPAQVRFVGEREGGKGRLLYTCLICAALGVYAGCPAVFWCAVQALK